MDAKAPDTAGERYRNYLKNAEEAEQKAASLPKSSLREGYQKLARGWRDLATQISRSGKL